MKSIKLRIAIYIVVFLTTAVLTYIINIGAEGTNRELSTMGNPTLPVVHMQTEGGLSYNYLLGYTGEVDYALLHDAITPIDSDRRLDIYIDTYGNSVSGISYEIREISEDRLIERTDVTDYDTDSGTIKAALKFKNLLEDGKEYMLKCTLEGENGQTADYYTRLVMLSDNNVDMKLGYVETFSENITSQSTLENVVAKLEPDSTGDNTNLGRVNIHSKLSQVGFGDLNITEIGDRYITLNEIDKNTASVTIRYEMTTEDETGSFSYVIKEFFRINQPDDTVTYVYSYDRFMDQLFDPEESISSTGEIYLGICSDTESEMESSSNGKQTAFVRNQSLYHYDLSKNKMTAVFCFAEDTLDGIRELHDEHDIKILSIDNSGNIKFLVYGYMNRGLHEGELGISVCSYSAEDNQTTEVVFIPRTDSFKLIERDINTLAYLNGENILYICNEGNILYLDCSTRESMVVADGILRESSFLSENNGLFMYQTGTDADSCEKISFLQLATGEITAIDADSGNYIKALGFIDDNIIYGEADASMTAGDANGNDIFPMYKITLVDSGGNVVREYARDGVYVTGITLGDSMLELKLAVQDESGDFISIASDRLLSNVKDTKTDLTISERTTDSRQKEYYISLLSSGTDRSLSTAEAKYVFTSDSTIAVNEPEQSREELYFVYGYGCFYLITSELDEALAGAYESGGVVMAADHDIIWTKYKSRENSIQVEDAVNYIKEDARLAVTDYFLHLTGVNKTAEGLFYKGASIFDVLASNYDHPLNLTGCQVEGVLNFIDGGAPVIAMTGQGQYELIYGYTATNVNTVNLTTGEYRTYTYSDFNNLILEYQNVMFTIYR